MARPEIKTVLALAVIAISAGAVLYLFDPAGEKSIYPSCPMREYIGVYCSGCGSLRALHQLAHGNIAAAARLNPLTVLLTPIVGYELIRYCIEKLSGKRLKEVFSSAMSIWVLLAVIIIFGILRNVPMAPFTTLAPH